MPLHIPDNYYYKAPSADVAYTTVPTGNLSVSNLLEHKPAWRKFDGQFISKPKAIILNDWRACDYLLPEFADQKKAIIELLSKGFKIYFYADGKLQQLDKDNLEPIVKNVNLPMPKKEMVELAQSELDLAPDKIEVVDAYTLDSMIYPYCRGRKVLNNKHILTSSRYCKKNDEYAGRLTKSVMPETGPVHYIAEPKAYTHKVNHFHRLFDCADVNPTEISGNYALVSISPGVWERVDSENELRVFIEQNKSAIRDSKHFGLIKPREPEIPPRNTLGQQTPVEGPPTESKEDTLKLLQGAADKLQALHQVNYHEQKYTYTNLLSDSDLTNLIQDCGVETLALDSNAFNKDNISELLERSPSVTGLELHGEEEFVKEALSESVISRLQKLDMRFLDDSVSRKLRKDYERIFRNGENLVELRLPKGFRLRSEATEWLKDCSLPNLEVFDAQDNTMEALHLAWILKISPSLRVLKASGVLKDEYDDVSNIESVKVLSQIESLNLEELDAKGWDQSTNDFLFGLLCKSTKLKSFICPKRVDVVQEGKIDVMARSLANLEYLELEDKCTLDEYYFKRIFGNCPLRQLVMIDPVHISLSKLRGMTGLRLEVLKYKTKVKESVKELAKLLKSNSNTLRLVELDINAGFTDAHELINDPSVMRVGDQEYNRSRIFGYTNDRIPDELRFEEFPQLTNINLKGQMPEPFRVLLANAATHLHNYNVQAVEEHSYRIDTNYDRKKHNMKDYMLVCVDDFASRPSFAHALTGSGRNPCNSYPFIASSRTATDFMCKLTDEEFVQASRCCGPLYHTNLRRASILRDSPNPGEYDARYIKMMQANFSLFMADSPDLEELVFQFPLLNDEVVDGLFINEAGSKIKRITLGQVSLPILFKIIECCPELERISASGDFELTPEMKKKMIEINPKLKIPGRRGTNIHLHQENSIVSAKGWGLGPGITSSDGRFQNIDADTSNQNAEYNADKIFHRIDNNPGLHPVSEYRMQVYNQININKDYCNQSNILSMDTIYDEKQLQPADNIICFDATAFDEVKSTQCDEVKGYGQYNVFEGKQELHLTDKFQAIAMVDTNIDSIKALFVEPEGQYEIKKCEELNQYLIRSTGSNHSVVVRSIHKVDWSYMVSYNSVNGVPQEVNDLVYKYKCYTEGALEVPEPATGVDYIEALKSQGVGACRHRAVAFMHEMQENFPDIPVRIVSNQVHTFVEVQGTDGKYYMLDLGGYRAKMNYRKVPDPVKAQEQANMLLQQVEESTSRRRELQLLSEQAAQDAQQKITSNPLARAFNQQSEYASLHNQTQLCEMVCGEPSRNVLIGSNNQSATQSLSYQMKKYCKGTSRRYFEINNPEDLVCSASYITKGDDNVGTINRGPGGKLYDFLQECEQSRKEAVLIINYDNFDADDIVRHNSIIDENRFADGTPIPDSVKVVGMITPSVPGTYAGADFYSRVKFIETELEADTDQRVNLDMADESVNEAVVIDLYANVSWRDKLSGAWELTGDTLMFKDSPLVKALKQGAKNIVLKNAPWNDPKLYKLLKDAQLSGELFGCDIRDVTFYQDFGYDLNYTTVLHGAPEFTILPSKEALLLNSETYNKYFSQYSLIEGNRIKVGNGIIENAVGSKLTICVTQKMHLESWAMLLDECKKYAVHVELQILPDIELPTELFPKIASTQKVKPGKDIAKGKLDSTNYIQSNDTEFTLEQIDSKRAIVIDISEIDESALINRLDARFDEDTMQFKFFEEIGLLERELELGKHVILTGRISPSVQQHLYSVLQQRYHGEQSGCLTIISEQVNPFYGLTNSFVSPEDVKKLKEILSREFPGHDDIDLAGLKLAQARGALRYAERNPSAKPNDAWKMFYHIDKPAADAEYDLANAFDIANAFDKRRIDLMQKVLDKSPFVVLTGLTGVGKSAFMHRVHQGKLFKGEEAMREWATSAATGPKTLFIDEANISARQWSEFAAMLNNNPPGILIDNEYFELSQNHKVVFACNPMSYSDDRQLPELFANHANGVIFDPMPPEYIYERILKPLFAGSALEGDVQNVVRPILDMYQHLIAMSDDKVLITARELTAVALFTINHCRNNPDDNAVRVAKGYSYDMAKQLLPAHQWRSLEGFETELPSKDNVHLPEEFVVTRQHQLMLNKLDDFLSLREFRQRDAHNDHQKRGGLNGFVIEGEPGIGKSEAMYKLFAQRGLREKSIHGDSSEGDYYKIPVSMPLDEKKKLLIKAFNEGAIVLIDEINSSTMIERLLNDLLDGKNPDGRPADNPGFLVIGTQNPATMSGRVKESPALARRMQKICLPPYSTEEMLAILDKVGLDQHTANQLVASYEVQKENNSKLCFRDVLRVARKINNVGIEQYKDELDDLMRARPFTPMADRRVPSSPVPRPNSPNRPY